MRRSLGSGLALLLAAVAVGCGGDDESTTSEEPAVDEAPVATESIEDFAVEFEEAALAAEEDDCESFFALMAQGGAEFANDCELARTFLDDLNVEGTASYESAAVIDASAPGNPESANAAWLGALNPEGDWTFTVEANTDEPTIGTTPEDQEEFDSLGETWLESIREEDCNTWFDVTVTPPGQSKADACKGQFDTPYPELLSENPDIALEPLGGNAYFQFYGLAFPDQAYMTVMMGVASPPDVPVTSPDDPPIVSGVVLSNGEAPTAG